MATVAPSPPPPQGPTWPTPARAPHTHTHIYARIRKYLCSNPQTRLFCEVCVRVRARACGRQTKPAVCCSWASEADLPQCLHCLQRREGCGEREGEGRCGPPPRAGTRAQVPSAVGWLRASLQPTGSRLRPPPSGEAKLQQLTSGRMTTGEPGNPPPQVAMQRSSCLNFKCSLAHG